MHSQTFHPPRPAINAVGIYRAALLAVLAAALALSGCSVLRPNAAAPAGATGEIRQGALTITIQADGVVRPAQSATLRWRTSGRVAETPFTVGQQVQTGDTLAALEPASLPRAVLLAQAEVVSARRALAELQTSRRTSAAALKAVEDAQKALDEAQHPELALAQAQTALAAALQTLGDARRYLAILTAPVSPQALEQARLTVLQAEYVRDQTQTQVDRIRKRLSRTPDKFQFFEDPRFYKLILENLERKLLADQRALDRAQERYNALLTPPEADDVATAETAVAAATKQAQHFQRLVARLAAGPTPGDIAALQAALEDARRSYERLKDGPADEDLQAAEARLLAAQAAADAAQITAPFAGVLTQVNAQPGDLAAAGSPAFRLDDLSTLLVDVQVSEVDINRARPGEAAFITLDGAPGRSYTGEVVEVLAVGSAESGVVTYRVTIAVRDADANLRPGMTASAQIVVETLPDVLLAPAQAVRYQSGSRTLFVLRAGQPVAVPVELGATADGEVQIISGDLRPGEQVLLSPPAETNP